MEFLASIAGSKTVSEEDTKRLETISSFEDQIYEKNIQITQRKLNQLMSQIQLTEDLRKQGLSEQEISDRLAENQTLFEGNLALEIANRDVLQESLDLLLIKNRVTKTNKNRY